jgi:outer membrane protein assembly factor BamB
LAGGKLILQRDGASTNSQVIALEPGTGKTIWEAARPLAGECYSTPMVWHIRKEIPREAPGNSFTMRNLMGVFIDANKDKIVTQAEWEASEAFSKDKFNADRFVAIRPGGRDDRTDTHVQWETTKGLSEMPSPLFYRGRVHFLRDGGLWTVLDPKTGKRLLDRERLGTGGQTVASPIAANGHIYVVNEPGTFTVLRAGDTLDVAAVNKLGESVRATPAIAGDALYVRSDGHLWAFGEKQRALAPGSCRSLERRQHGGCR